MKNLYDYIQEGILDNANKQLKDLDSAIHKNVVDEIINYITENYTVAKSNLKVSKKTNSDGKYIVNSKRSVVVKNKDIESIDNELFVWGKVDGNFECYNCHKLKNLIGSPEYVGGNFSCCNCTGLITLMGSPKEVMKDFDCRHCANLKTLEGCSEIVNGNFYCTYCKGLISLKGAPRKTGNFTCYGCESLVTLEGAPDKVWCFDCRECKSLASLNGASKEVGMHFQCYNCKVFFTKDMVRAVSNIDETLGTIFNKPVKH